MTPAVSVCVPTYNGTKYLRECLDSILVQSFEHFEVIVADDQSCDGTFDLAQEYASRDGRVRLFRNPENLGLVGNWNRCLDLAQGEWIKYVFQDDRIVPQCLENLLKQSRRDVPLTVCQRDCLFDGVSAAVREAYEKLLAVYRLAELFPGLAHVPAELFCVACVKHLAVNFIGEPTAVMFHRDVPRRFGRFNPDFIQLCDFEYWARIASHTGFVSVPETLASFRVHRDSATANNEEIRYFRSDAIDPLLLIYQYVYDVRFAPVRKMARGLGVNLRRIVAERAHQTASLARRDARDPLIADPGPQEAWLAIVSRYPELERSLYANVHKIREGLDRHVVWRFRNDSFRRQKQHTAKVPIVVTVDIEPDAFFTDRNRPVPWSGYERVYEFLSSVRARLASATGLPAKFFWTLRMDPQIADTYGAPDWAARHYAKAIQDCVIQGDEFGVHTHAYRWDSPRRNWVVDHGNQPWVDHCVISSFESFRKVFGEDCRSFRFGDGWMSNETMQLVEKLGADFDLTLEPGQEPRLAVFPDKPFTGSLPDLTAIPVHPYRPDRSDFRKSDPVRNDGIWIIPLSAGPVSEDFALVTTDGKQTKKRRYQTLNLACEPEQFRQIMHNVLTTLDRPYLTLVTRSDIGSCPRMLRNLKVNFSNIIRHPMVKQFVFCTPADAMARLGFGAESAPLSAAGSE